MLYYQDSCFHLCVCVCVRAAEVKKQTNGDITKSLNIYKIDQLQFLCRLDY